MKEVMDACVRKRWSPAKLIHNSVQFQEQYSDMMEAEQIWRHNKLKDLGMSAQKFNSIAKPFVRGTMSFTAICAQMERLWELREGSSEEATYAREWAEWLELKHAILHGFMADAASETMKLIREWEPDKSDLSSGYMENAWHLVETVTVIFKEKSVGRGHLWCLDD